MKNTLLESMGSEGDPTLRNPGDMGTIRRRAFRDKLETLIGLNLLSLVTGKRPSLFTIVSHEDCRLANAIYRHLPRLAAKAARRQYNGWRFDEDQLWLAKRLTSRWLELLETGWPFLSAQFLMKLFIGMEGNHSGFWSYWRKGTLGPFDADYLSKSVLRREKARSVKTTIEPTLELDIVDPRMSSAPPEEVPKPTVYTVSPTLRSFYFDDESSKKRGKKKGSAVAWKSMGLPFISVELLSHLEQVPGFSTESVFQVSSLDNLCRTAIAAYCKKEGLADGSGDKEVVGVLIAWCKKSLLVTKRRSRPGNPGLYKLTSFGRDIVKVRAISSASEEDNSDK